MSKQSKQYYAPPRTRRTVEMSSNQICIFALGVSNHIGQQNVLSFAMQPFDFERARVCKDKMSVTFVSKRSHTRNTRRATYIHA